jgi:hypothetical protein
MMGFAVVAGVQQHLLGPDVLHQRHQFFDSGAWALVAVDRGDQVAVAVGDQPELGEAVIRDGGLMLEVRRVAVLAASPPLGEVPRAVAGLRAR